MEELIPHLVCFTKLKTGLFKMSQPHAQAAVFKNMLEQTNQSATHWFGATISEIKP